jgi:lipopolysaccharide transport system ATP-binding protein
MEDAPRLEGELVIAGPWLRPGRYRLDLYLCTGSGIVDLLAHACVFEVNAVLPYPHSASDTATKSGVVFADYQWRARDPQAMAPAALGERVGA